ncbi:LOW QUALITY PROTEIN: nose resistant to fluoxetine protein 6 [Nilaparvata lugens]|uniref:LOW QUALITY PROTEIN: nose resistant to fluoxetine protein 6 n=1 Tax=Nilaparvata lugens TaxID=108931 RepID=UPI00193DD4E5|nr:LOW QUALITY PROTEIN: nose resistant to fluoxetine protein 6 [Nilaparvata lugens]
MVNINYNLNISLAIVSIFYLQKSCCEPTIEFSVDKSSLQATPLLNSNKIQDDFVDDNFSISDNANTLMDKKNETTGENRLPEASNITFPWQMNLVFTPSGGNGLCQQHTQMFLHDLKNFQRWSLQMWDATAKLGSGLFSGNANQLGDFDSCLQVKSGDMRNIQAKYCLALVDLQLTSDAAPILRDLVNRIQGENFVRGTRNDPGHFVPRFSSIGWGVCVPSSCDEQAIEAGLMSMLAPLNSTSGLLVHAGVPTNACYKVPQTLPISTLLALTFYAAVISLAIYATVIDKGQVKHAKNKGTLERLVTAFSLKGGLRAFLAPGTDAFPCIHGIRALFTVMLLVAHKVIPLASILYSDRVNLTRHSNTTWSSLLRASNIYTDSFLLMSAALTSYYLAKEISTKGSINWPGRLVTRYIRLTPPLLAVIVYYAYVMEYMGSGPQWSSVVNANADLCKASLWKNLLYIQNFFPFEKMCATHTHQLALDMQMFLLAPALVYILHWEKFLGLALFLMIAIASTALRFYAIFNNNISLYIHYGATVTELYNAANFSYGQTTHRIVPYLSGICLGYFLYKSKKSICLTPKCAVFGWGLSIAFCLYSVFSQAHLAMPNHIFDAYDAAIYAALSPFTWALSLSWLILTCSTGHAGMYSLIT